MPSCNPRRLFLSLISESRPPAGSAPSAEAIAAAKPIYIVILSPGYLAPANGRDSGIKPITRPVGSDQCSPISIPRLSVVSMLTKDPTNNPINQGRILAIDSDSTICEMIRTHFGPERFSVDYCTSYEDLFSLNIAGYALVIISLDLDDADYALSLVEQIKQHRVSARTGIITCSSQMSPATVIDSLNAGADDHLLKPYSLRELMARVRAVLRRHI